MYDTLSVPDTALALAAFFLGTVIGSFLNVVIYRLHTKQSIAGRSHCLTCGTSLQWFELVPLASFIVLRARCRTCRAKITPRYALVELLTGVLFSGVVLTTPLLVPALLMLAVVAVLVVVVVYDYYHYIIPNILVGWLLALAVGWLGYQWYTGVALETLATTFVAALAGAGFFAALWWFSGGRWLGLGDAKLVFPLSSFLTVEAIFSFLVVSFWIGAIISLLVIAGQRLYRRGQPHLRYLPQPLTIKSEVPFAPFLVLGWLVVYFWSFNVLSFVSFLSNV